MKRILFVLICSFIISGCTNEEQNVTCISPEVLRNNQCIIIPNPEITLEGLPSIIIEAGTPYIDPGVQAIYDGEEINVIVDNLPNTSVLGEYIITYNAEINGVHAEEVTRTVTVVDTTAPIIVFNPFDDFNHELGVPYLDLSITVTDNYDDSEDITVIRNGNIDVNTLGEYELSYYAIDSNGNQSETITKTVTVMEPETLSFTERYLKDHTALYSMDRYPNNYTYEVIEWIHPGLKIVEGEYVPVYYFFLHNEIEEKKVLKKIEFVCPTSDNYVYILDDSTIDYAFEIPLDCLTNDAITIITYAHDDYDKGNHWTASMSMHPRDLTVNAILSKELKKGNLM